MTDKLAAVFNRASNLAARGEYGESAAEYGKFLNEVAASARELEPKDVDFAVRSASFNFAQVLNHLGRFREALEQTDSGLSRSPSQVGRAIGLSARGEALCGLGRIDEGKAAFEQAIEAHPIFGKLNAADSMTRVSVENMLDAAARLVLDVEHSLMKEAVQSPKQRGADQHTAELYTIRGKILVRRGQYSEAKKWFDKALQIDGSCEDAKLQIRNLPASRSIFSRMFGELKDKQ